MTGTRFQSRTDTRACNRPCSRWLWWGSSPEAWTSAVPLQSCKHIYIQLVMNEESGVITSKLQVQPKRLDSTSNVKLCTLLPLCAPSRRHLQTENTYSLNMNHKEVTTGFRQDPCMQRHGPDDESASLYILVRLTPLEAADLWHLLPGNDPMEPVWDHTGAEGRSELRLDRLTQVHHQTRQLI